MNTTSEQPRPQQARDPLAFSKLLANLGEDAPLAISLYMCFESIAQPARLANACATAAERLVREVEPSDSWLLREASAIAGTLESAAVRLSECMSTLRNFAAFNLATATRTQLALCEMRRLHTPILASLVIRATEARWSLGASNDLLFLLKADCSGELDSARLDAVDHMLNELTDAVQAFDDQVADLHIRESKT